MHGVPQLGIRWNTYTCAFLCYFRAHTTECRALYYYAVVRMLGECSRAQGIAFTLKHIHGIKFIILCYRIIVRGIFHNIYGSKKKNGRLQRRRYVFASKNDAVKIRAHIRKDSDTMHKTTQRVSNMNTMLVWKVQARYVLQVWFV